MGPLPPPEVIELGSSSEDDDDDLKRAIALSLEEVAGPAKSPINVLGADSESSKSGPQLSDPPAAHGMAAFGSMLLDRKKMEEERQARIAKRKWQEDGSSGEAPAAQKPRLANEASVKESTGQLHKPTNSATVNPASATALSSCSLPFPKGAVKRTWTYGYERKGDDIKIEEVLQKDHLKLAVLASYQWDDEWLLSKIDISRTRLVCVAYASDEAHKDQMRANVPSSHVRFCFPPMGGYGAMHAKIQVLKFPDYVRIVVPTGNLTSYDWGETGVLENVRKASAMVFLIDLPPLGKDASFTPTQFSTELFRFLRALGLDDRLVSTLTKYNFSETKNYGFVHTIAGSHSGDDWQNTGYSGLARTINDLRLASEAPVDVDFVCSSLGSLKREYLSSLYAAFQGKSGNENAESLIVRTSRSKPARDEGPLADHLRVYFPSQKTVSGSRGGPASAGTITFRSEWWEASTFPREVLRDCVCRRRGLLVHSKAIFVRHGPSGPAPIGWVYVGSANLSESAWGRLVKDKSSGRPKMTCRNWECGVVLPAPTRQTPSGAGATAGTRDLDEVFGGYVPIPIVTPAAEYNSTASEAQPWFF